MAKRNPQILRHFPAIYTDTILKEVGLPKAGSSKTKINIQTVMSLVMSTWVYTNFFAATRLNTCGYKLEMVYTRRMDHKISLKA